MQFEHLRKAQHAGVEIERLLEVVTIESGMTNPGNHIFNPLLII
jgi:hypothetical protein